MATVIPKQPQKDRDQMTIWVDRNVLQNLEHYCRYLEFSASPSSSVETKHSLCGSRLMAVAVPSTRRT